MAMNASRVQTHVRPVFGAVTARFSGKRPQELDYAALAQTTTMQRNGNGISGRVTFTLETPYPLNAEDASKIQMLKGYHPAGYDFFGFNNAKSKEKKNTFVSTWQCSTSCD